MHHQEEELELEEMGQRLREDGLPPTASPDERQRHLWRLLRRCEGSLASATQDLQTLRTQQAAEMKEVENYVEHIRNLLEDRESLTAEYERENEQLRAELQQMKIQQDAQLKEVVEMLDQEGLADISQSSPSEQVAYLLVERATLLERLEAAERKVDTQSLTGSLREVHLQEELDHIRRTMEEELRQQRETMQRTKESMNKDQQSAAQSPWKKLFRVCKAEQGAKTASSVHSEELSGERLERQRMERDLDEASRRLTMAHEEIRRLTDELDSARKTQSVCEPELERAGQEVEQLRQEVDRLKECDATELQRARELNARLDQEIRALRDRVRTLDAERKTLLLAVENMKTDSNKEQGSSHLEQVAGKDGLPLTTSAAGDQDRIHKRCRLESQDKECRLRELQRRLQRQQEEQEELVERNEELESLLGEAQNASKAERERHDCEVEGLQRKIKHLEAEVTKLSSQEPAWKGGDLSKESEVYLQQLRTSSQERVALLEGRLTEEKEWRKQLEVDLTAAQAALKKEKEELHREQKERKKLRAELQTLQLDSQQGKASSTSLTQLKGEKDILQEKVSQLERAQNRLQSELDLRTSAYRRAQEELRESRSQVSELSAQVGRLRSEASGLERERSTLRAELQEEQGRAAELQRRVGEEAQEKRRLQGEREQLNRELQRAREQQQASTPEGRGPPRDPDPQLSPPLQHSPRDGGLSQLASLKMEMTQLHSTLEEERQLASQHQLALQAQISEAQARIKSQDALQQQKGEECKQLRQDLQRTQSLFSSAERELRYERERSLDLKRHNALLEQEKMKVCAELKQAQAKVSQLEQTGAGQRAELERLQQRGRELELELGRSSQSRHASSGLQDELSAERTRLIAADKKVLELQLQLKNTLHQLRLEEARASETTKLERDTRELSDSLSVLRAQLQDEQLQRKLLEQREAELQQQVRSLRSKEAALNRANGELGHRLQELETRLEVRESERSRAAEEQLSSQACKDMQGQLASSQQESERLQEELQQVIQQLDTQIRKYNEKQAHHRMKLRKAKQIFLKETAQRDGRIQKLENDLALATSLSEKERDWIKRVMEENEKLLLEQRDLLRRLNEAEEMGSSSQSTASTVQHRVKFLEEENRYLEEKTLQLSSQVGALERALRKVQSVCNMEDLKKVFPSECLLNDSLLQTSNSSMMSGVCDTLGLLDAIRRVKVGGSTEGTKTSSPLPPPQPSEIGYLNVTSPMASTCPHHDPEENLGLGIDEV
ncbi:coiled-coil domain-containing protein 30 isoform X2 [Anguilla rostrata]|uniref:coiled-coil domain-containing protein 30 isoform X2 n=1 Tax=Anguilla rostrata TaxID=7938 RepID=UPI0030CB8ADA